jgi:hypothetical protein
VGSEQDQNERVLTTRLEEWSLHTYFSHFLYIHAAKL